MKKNLLTLFMVLGTIGYNIAQNYNLPSTGTNSISACSGTLYDPGGTSNYGNNQNSTTTICPSTPGTKIQLNFTSFNLENSVDYIIIYDGNSTAAPTLGTYSGTSSPGLVQATPSNTSGCITIKWVTDGSVTRPGFAATISCFVPCQNITANFLTSTPADVGGLIKICPGTSVSVTGSGTFSNSSAGATYTWHWGDGTTSNGTSGSHTYNTPGIYNISLVITDPNGCTNTNFVYKTVQVSPLPTLNTSASPSTICLGESSNLTGSASNGGVSLPCTPPVSGLTFLPDGSGVSYTTSIDVSCYNAGQNITSASDIASLCVTMEHSYLGDLNMVLICPNGQQVTLHQYPSGGGLYLGAPIDVDADLTPGVGATYCFTPTATTTLIAGSTITAGSPASNSIAPGNYKPIDNFSNFVGCPINGTWTIQITDNLASDNGYIFDWQLNLTIPTPPSSSFTPTITSTEWQATSGLTQTSPTTATVTPTTPGSNCYTFSATNDFGCSNTTQQCITVNTGVTPTINNPNLTVCAGSTASFTASLTGATSYSWTGPNGFTASTATINIPNAQAINAGNYTVTVVGPNGCSASTTANLTVNTPPTPTISSNSPLCVGGTLNLNGPTIAGANYVWSGPAGFSSNLEDPSRPSLTAAHAGNYSLYIVQSGCTSSTATTNVVVNPLPTVNAGPDVAICIGNSVTLSGSGATSYSWDHGVSNGVAFNPTSTQTYTLTGTDANGCSNTDQVVVNVNPLPVVNAGPDQTICIGASVTLSGSGASTYTWNNGVTNGVAFNPTSTQTYTLTGTDANGCSNTDQVVVNVNPLPNVNAGADQTICIGASVTLSGSGASTYTWNNGVSNGVAFNPTSTQTYTLTGTDANGCVNTDQVVVNVNPLPNVNAGADQTICIGASVTLTGSGASTYTWDQGISNGVAFNPTSTQTYTLTGTDANGCVNTDQVVVNVNPLPIVDAGPDQSICYGTVTSVNASGAVSYVWDQGVSNGSNFIPTTTQTYTVIGTDANGCSNTDQLTINIIPNPIVNAGLDQTVCYGTEVILAASGAQSYIWDNGISDNTPFNAFNTFTYTVIGTASTGCNDTDQVVVTVLPNPTVNAGADITVCYGTEVTLTASGANSYVWDQGISNGVPFHAFGTTTYTVIGTDINNCNDTDQVVINVWANPIVDPGNDITVCYGSSVTLTGNGATSYIWDQGVSNNVPFIALNTTTYTVIGTDANNCKDTAQVTINVHPELIISGGADQTVCYGSIVTLTGSGAQTYVWDQGITNNNPFVALNTTTYTVIGTDANGCKDTAQVTVNVHPELIISGGADQTVCYGTIVTLTGSGAQTYVWDNGITDNTPFVALNTNTYTVIGTDINGCNDTAQVTVNVHDELIIDPGQDQTVCYGAIVTLAGSGAQTYVWDNGISDNTPFVALNTTTYTVIGTDANGCKDTAQVTVNVIPELIISGGPDQTVCYGSIVTLSGSGANTYVWDNGITDNTPFVALNTTTYTVIGTDANGCKDTAQVTVNVHDELIIDPGQDQTVCYGAIVTLAGSGAQTYVWNNGITDNTPFVALNTTTYTVIGTDANGCNDTAQVTVNVHPELIISGGADQTVCYGSIVTLAGSGAVGHVWDQGITDNTPFIALNTSTYTVIGTDANGCNDTAQVTVNVHDELIIDPGQDQTVCYGTVVTLSGSGAQTFVWDNGITDNTPFVALNTTNYTVIGTDANGCKDTAQVTVNVHDELIIDPGQDQTVCYGTIVTLAGSGAQTYVWDNGITDSIPFVALNTTTYTAIGTDANGCKDTAQVTVNVHDELIIDPGQDQTVCYGAIVTLAGSGAQTFVWDNGITDNTPFVALNTTNYTVIGTDANGCKDTAQVTVNVHDELIIDPGQDQTVCYGAIVTLNGSGAQTYVWDNGITDNIPFVALNTTTYTVIGTDANGCNDTAQVTVNVHNELIIEPGQDQTVCYGAIVTLAGSGAQTFVWDNGITDNTPFVALNTTNYTVIGTDANGCKDTAQVTVNVHDELIIDPGQDQTVCYGAIVTLNGSGAQTYVWDNGITDNIPFVALNTTTYTVIGTDANGCKDTAQVTVNVHDELIIDPGQDQTVCYGAIVTLNGSGAQTYVWDNGITDNIPFVALNTTTYTAIGTDVNGCKDTAQVTVNVHDELIIDPGQDQTVCYGAIVTLAGSGAQTFVWDNGITDNTPFVALNTTTYTVIGTDSYGCNDTSQVLVSVLPELIISGGTDQTVCYGSVVTLNGSGAQSYIWDNGITDNTPFVAINTITYTVIGTAGNGCNDTAQVTVNVHPELIIDGGPAQTVCYGSIVTLSGSGAQTYVWDQGITDNIPFVALNTNTYTVIGTDANGCNDTTQVTVNVHPELIISGGTDLTVCYGSIVTLAGSGAQSYVWDQGITDNTPFVALNSTNYTVIGTDINGCKDTAQVMVTVHPELIIDGGSDQTVCYGSILTLSGTGAQSYIWDQGIIDNTPFVALNTTTYTVIGTDANGCNDTAQVTVNVHNELIIDGGPDQTVCHGTIVTLSGSGAQSYVWDNGVTDSNPFPALSTITYTVVGTDANNCQDTAQVTINVLANPVVDAGPDTSVCYGSLISLSGNGATSYVWDQGITDAVPFHAFSTITYTVIGTDNNNCNDTDQVVINVWSNPVVTTNNDTSICYGNNITLTANGALNYIWDQGISNGVSFLPLNTNTYTVIGFDGNNCSDTSQVIVNILTNPTVDAGPDQTVCDGTNITLSGSGALTYQWDNGVNDGVSFPINSSTTFTVIGFDSFNCSDTDQVYIHVNPIPAAPIITSPNAFCETDNGIIDVQSVPGASYFWTTPNGTNPITEDIQLPNISAVAQGNYQVYIVVNACTSDVTNHYLTVNPIYHIPVSHSICEGSKYEFLGNTYYNAGSYDIPFQTVNGCDSIITLHLTLMTTPTADFHMPVSEGLNEGNVEVIDESIDAISVSYFTSNGVTSNSPNFMLNFNTDGEITVTQIAVNGVCKDSISKTIIIKPEGNVYIPNSFTPGEDGLNDTWKPIISYATEYKVMIFDRWGELVYESENIYEGWNGGWQNNLDRPVQQGTYVYKIMYKAYQGKEQHLIGHINLLK